MELKVDALVVRTADYGESDRMLTLFSLQNGKISAAAKGVRKAGAKLRFAAQPFCFAEYVLAQKGERYTMISASGTDGFYELRQDIGKFYAAASLAGLCDAVLPEGIVNEELFLRAVNSLKEMCEGDAALALISFLSNFWNFRDICSISPPVRIAEPFWKGRCFLTLRADVFTVPTAPAGRA